MSGVSAIWCPEFWRRYSIEASQEHLSATRIVGTYDGYIVGSCRKIDSEKQPESEQLLKSPSNNKEMQYRAVHIIRAIFLAIGR